MPRNYRFYNYYPDYGYAVHLDGNLLAAKEFVPHAVCFREVFTVLERQLNTTDVQGVYTLRCRKEFKEGTGNFCVVNKSEIKRLLRYMRDSLQVEISMEDTLDNYVFTMKVDGKPIKHKFALTFLRVFYEYPYNEWAKEAFRIRDLDAIPGIKHMSFLKIFYIIRTTFSQHDHGGHSLFDVHTRKLSIHRYRKACEEGKARVQQVYNQRGRGPEYKRLYLQNFTQMDWDADIDKRIETYSENFRLLRNEKGIRRRVRN